MMNKNYKIAKELRHIKAKDVIGDLYNEDKEVEFTIDDVVEDFSVNFEMYFSTLRGIFEDNKELVQSNKEIIEPVLSKAVESMESLKGEYIR